MGRRFRRGRRNAHLQRIRPACDNSSLPRGDEGLLYGHGCDESEAIPRLRYDCARRLRRNHRRRRTRSKLRKVGAAPARTQFARRIVPVVSRSTPLRQRAARWLWPRPRTYRRVDLRNRAHPRSDSLPSHALSRLSLKSLAASPRQRKNIQEIECALECSRERCAHAGSRAGIKICARGKHTDEDDMNSKKRLRVGILFGGRSGEHEVSLASAASVIRALDPEKYEAVPIGISKDGRWLVGTGAQKMLSDVLKSGERVSLPPDPTAAALVPLAAGTGQPTVTVDVVFPVLHGTFGEDGTVQGLLELANLPYVGTGVLASAVGMDKDVQKRLFDYAGLPIVPYLAIRRAEWENDRAGVISR